MGNSACGFLWSGAYGVERYPVTPTELDPKTGWYGCVFWHDYNAVADEVIFRIKIRRFSFGRNHGSVGNPGILIDNSAINHAIAADPDRRSPRICMSILLEVVRSHHDAIANGGAALNNAADPNDAAFQMSIRNDAAVRNNRLPQSGAVDFAAWQKARMRINRRFRVEETVFRHKVRKIEIRFIKSAARSD